MLKTLDILIGIATVMLLFSMAVTIVTQFFTTILGSRGRNLRNGLAGLLRQMDPTLQEKIASKIADGVLSHPLLASQHMRKIGFSTKAASIHREEFTTLLMEIGSGQSPVKLEQSAKDALVQLLNKNGIPDPAGTLNNIRDMAMQLEAANPALANDVRHGMAILSEAKSHFVAKIHGWFDQTIDRVSDRFTLTARMVTFIAATVVAVGVQLDTFALVNRLSVDDKFREGIQQSANELLNKAKQAQDAAKETASPTPTTTPTPAPSSSGGGSTAPPTATVAPAPADTPDASGKTVQKDQAAKKTDGKGAGKDTKNENKDDLKAGDNAKNANDAAKTTKNVQQDYYNLLSAAGLITLPTSWNNWWGKFDGGKIPGILLSALLLSLGAPFWYNSLQDLLRLRSMVAKNDQSQRTIRQTTQSTTSPDDGTGKTVAATVPDSLQGEQGDLKAIG